MKNKLICPIGRTILFLIFSLHDVFITPALAEPVSNTVEVVTIDYPPLLGGPGTVMTDITTAAFEAAGIGVNYSVYPMARVVLAISNSIVPAALGSKNWFFRTTTNDPDQFVSIYRLNMHFFYLKDRFPQGITYETLSELRHHSIGYIRGGALTPIFAEAGIAPELVTLLRQNVDRLRAGRDDMFAASELGGWEIIRKHYADEVDQFAATEKPIVNISGDIIFSKENLRLKEPFLRGLKTIMQDGTYLSIMKKFYGEKNVPAHVHELIENSK